MRTWPLACLALGTIGLLWPLSRPTDEWTILIAGDLDGYLAPCGCTKPMSGGIRRMATVVRQSRVLGPTAFLVNGGLVVARGRQDEIKAETLAECLKDMNVSAINVGPADAKLGRGMAASVGRLSGGKLVCTSLEETEDGGIAALAHIGPFVVGGVAVRDEAVAVAMDGKPRKLDAAVQMLVDAARDERSVPLLLLQGSLSDARLIAAHYPELALIVYRSGGDPPSVPVRVGSTVLLTPGEFAKHVIRVKWRNGRVVDYAAVSLGVEYADDPEVGGLYRAYLSRVDQEGLLDEVPRGKTGAYAGPTKCGECHRHAFATWRKSAHARALRDLEAEGHERDPDCVGCHVTGLDSTRGFRSRKGTPSLADVGCEACHGPGAGHAEGPKGRKLTRLGPRSCVRCHDLAHSPGFVFPKFWARIAHR